MAAALVWLGMELTADEAADLLTRAFVICASVSGGTTRDDLARDWQQRVFALHTEQGRRHCVCAACGASAAGLDQHRLPDATSGLVLRARAAEHAQPMEAAA